MLMHRAPKAQTRSIDVTFEVIVTTNSRGVNCFKHGASPLWSFSDYLL
jgi:hypothetical protein